MQPSEFWQYLEQFGSLSDRSSGFWRNSEAVVEATRLLLAECSGAQQWIANCAACHLFLEMIVALRIGGWMEGGDSPKPGKYMPANCTFHHGIAEFRQLLFQHPVRGAINAIWSQEGCDYFRQPRSTERLATFVRDQLWQDEDPGYEEWCRPYGAAILLIRGDRVDIYPFPEQWTDIVEGVRNDLDHMTAREKVAAELPVVVKSFVDLLGWGPVMDELEILRPKDD